MAIPWMTALKLVPWGDVIEHTPKVLSAARRLLERQKEKQQQQESAGSDVTPVTVKGQQPSLESLKRELTEARSQIDELSKTQAQLTDTLAEMAEQQAGLVTAVEALRQRTRWLSGLVLALGAGVLLLWIRNT